MCKQKASTVILSAVLVASVLLSPARADPVAKPADPPVPNSVETQSITGQESMEKKMADCMAIWEPRTHMSKSQWRQTCKTTLKELPSL
jgi:hypothetical protein